MNQMDTPGVYRAKITEAAVSATKRGLPQFVAGLSLTEKWVDDSASMEHFGLEEPGWVDWSNYNEHTLGYFVLATEDKPLLNTEQVMKATGWDGASYAALAQMDLIGHEVLIRSDESEYEGKTRVRVEWIDERDAPVQRELSSLDSDKLRDLDKQFGFALQKSTGAKPAAAKPKADKPKADKPKADKPKADKPAAAPPPRAAPPKAEEPPAEDPPFDVSVFGDLPKDGDKAQVLVWDKLHEHSGGTDPETITNAWLANTEKIAGSRKDDELTPEDWAKIGLAAAADCNISFA